MFERRVGVVILRGEYAGSECAKERVLCNFERLRNMTVISWSERRQVLVMPQSCSVEDERELSSES